MIKGVAFADIPPARDVNAFDEVPVSSWFTQRLGYRDISPAELLRGPQKIGPPVKPVQVVKAKTGGGNPGFIIKDARGNLYLTKFDPPDFPAIETTTALIVNRLFWGFGYHVPEDYLAFFSANDFQIDPDGELVRADVDKVLGMVASPANGLSRTTVSLFLKGTILGPIPDNGLSTNDLNDRIPHENRRVLRALRVFNAFTNHSDIQQQ